MAELTADGGGSRPDGQFHPQPGDNVAEMASGTLRYFYREATSDRRRILIVFSGFREPGTLDFSGTSISPVRSDIVWIHDAFGPEQRRSYYLRQGGANYPELVVTEFIEALIEHFGIDPSMVVAAGFSKGGSAALYYAMKLGLGACITVVPQLRIGDYLRTYWADDARAIAGPGGEATLGELNELLPGLMRQGRHQSPVYLITSQGDPQYDEQIVPYWDEWSRLPGLSIVELNTHQVQRHIDVTAYGVPVIQGLMMLLLEGVFPKVGHQEVVDSGDTTSRAAELVRGRPEAWLRGLSITDGELRIELDTLIRGHDIPGHGVLDRSLVIGPASFPLGSVLDVRASWRLTRWERRDYTGAPSVLLAGSHVTVNDLPLGRHDVRVRMAFRAGGTPTTAKVTSKQGFWRGDVVGNSAVSIVVSPGETLVHRVLVDDIPVVHSPEHNRVDVLHLEEDRLKIKGALAFPGAVIAAWGDARYRLHLAHQSGGPSSVMQLGMLNRVDQVPASLSKAYYSDLGNNGVALSSVGPGVYKVRVVAIAGSAMATTGVIAGLVVDGGVRLVPVSSSGAVLC